MPAQSGLLPEDVQVWGAWLDVTREGVMRFQSTLSSQECERAARFVSERDRARFVAGRGFLREILGSSLGTEPQSVEFTYSAKGKPTLGGAFARSGLQFNLAHSGGLGVFAVARHGVVGVDVEHIRPIPDLRALIGRFLSARERARIEQWAGEEQVKGFFRIWTRKEAWLKANGEGLSDLLNTVEVVSPSGEGESCGAARDGLGGMPLCLHDLAPAPGYVGALAVTPQ